MSERDPNATATRGAVTVALDVRPRRVPRGAEATLTIGISLAPGWVIGSVVPDSRGAGEATAVHLGVAEGLRPGAMRFPEGSANPLGGERLRTYAGSVAIAVPLAVAPDALLGPAPVAARVLFQAVGEGRVLPPDRIEVSSTLEIVDATPGQPRSAETSS